MYLLVFDIINSRHKKLVLPTIFSVENHCRKYNIDLDKAEIAGGDQIRILSDQPQKMLEMVIDILATLNKFDLNARVYVTTGTIDIDTVPINGMQGDIFYKMKNLEIASKKGMLETVNQMYYQGNEYTDEISLLLESFAKLVLVKGNYLPCIYMSVYENLSQSKIGQRLNLSQSTINNQLVKANAPLVVRYSRVIGKLIEEDICSYTI